MENPTYLGDSVCALFDGCMIILTTENGYGDPSNTIALEPEVMTALIRFNNQVNELRAARAAKSQQSENQ